MYPMHPYQRNQVPYNPHYYPHFEPNPHHMNVDPTRSTLPYESWPCGGSYGHPYPSQCRSCCIHNNSPSHSAFRPPYPYLPPPTYSNCSYPAYPAHYVPPPHFNMKQSRYDYDKNMDRDHHCCGCPNHPCSVKKGGSNVIIEEHDQDNLEKRNESNESLVPLGFKNCSYPVVWLPPDDMKNRERMKPNESNCKEQEENPQFMKPFGDFRPFQQPNVWNVWPPHHGNYSESPKQRGDLPGKQQRDDVNRKQVPFPIIWMPYKPPEEDGEKVSKETESGLIAEKEPTSPSKLTKSMLHDSEDKRSNSKQKEVNSGSEIRGKGLNKESVVKTIPVKQVEQNEVLDGKKEEASQRHDSDAKQKKITQEGGKKQPPSPTKSSKLPPVCLRVDPLPRKKSSNGSSRSPSPPGGKGNFVESCSDRSKHPILSNEKENVQLDKSCSMPEKRIEVEPSKSKTKVVKVTQGMTKENKLQDQCTVFPDLKRQARGQSGEGDTSKATNEPKDQPDRVAAKAQSSNEGHQRGEAREAANRVVDAGNEMKQEKWSKLSNDKAATMIQSAYRGFNVRRWEPLKKLKQIAKIKEQMAELKNRVQALESSADNGVDNKQRIIITEAIMGLLLKLDTIQGLHPTVREYRKSVAKELVSLQEKLDLLNCKEQPADIGQTLTAKSSEDSCAMVEDNASLQGGLEVQKLERDDDSAKGDERINFDAMGPSEEQPLCATELLPNSHDVGNAEVLMGEEENKDVGEVMLDFPCGSAVETGDGASETPFESKEKTDDKLLDENAAADEKLEEHDATKQSLPNSIPFSEELIANSGSKVRGCGFKENSDVVDELEELPRGVLHEETSVQGSAEIRKDEALHYDKGDLTGHVPEEKVCDTENLQHHHLEALGETPVILGAENSDGQKENAEALERDGAVLIGIPKREKEDARPLSDDANISDVDDKVGMEKNEKELELGGSASDGFPIQSQEDTITTKQHTDTGDTEKSEPAEVLQEKTQNAVDRDNEILDSGKPVEQSPEPQLSSVSNDDVQEYHAQDKEEVGKDNMEVQGEELPAHNDVVVSLPDDHEGKKHNVDVEQRDVEQNFELQGEEPVAADNAAPVTKGSVDGKKGMDAPTSEAAATETELSGEKEVGVAEDHSTYPSACDSMEGNSADVADSLGSMPAEVRVMDASELNEWKKVDVSPPPPTGSQVSCNSDALSESDRKLVEENEKLREMMEKLIKAGNEQLTAISSLSGRVKDLEKRLSRKKKLKLKRNRLPASGTACVKPFNDPLGDRAVGLAM